MTMTTTATITATVNTSTETAQHGCTGFTVTHFILTTATGSSLWSSPLQYTAYLCCGILRLLNLSVPPFPHKMRILIALVSDDED